MQNSKVKLIVLCVSFVCCMSSNLTFGQLSRFGYNKYINDKGDTLNYRFLYPDFDTIRKFPLVIFLHGMGERGNDNESQLKWGITNFASDQMMAMHPAFVIAPQCPNTTQWSNSKINFKTCDVQLLATPSKPMELVIQLIHQLIKKYNIDTNRIYIMGLSMGGFGTYDAIERYPHLFAAAVPVCGGGDISKAASIAHLPMWIFHGSEDFAVNAKFSFNMFDALTKAGARPGFTQYPEVGHFSWISAFNDPLMIEWLFRQHK